MKALRRLGYLLPGLAALVIAWWGVRELRIQALMQAARDGRITGVGRMLDSGMDVNTRTFSGWTPLLVAVSAGQTETVRYLVGRGADRRARIDFKQKSALRLARDFHHQDTEALLVAMGCRE